jgi:hypothetical protein
MEQPINVRSSTWDSGRVTARKPRKERMKRSRSITILAAVTAAVGTLLAVSGPTAWADEQAAPSVAAGEVRMIAHGYVHQDHGNWCGPATARMILAAKIGVGRTPSQATLAKAMVQGSNDGTYRAEMATELTKYIDSGSYVYENLNDGAPLSAAQQATMFNYIQIDIPYNYGVAINVHVKHNGPKPSWFPNPAEGDQHDIDHWMAVMGYDTINNMIAVVDPADWGRDKIAADKDYHWIKITDIARYTKTYVH